MEYGKGTAPPRVGEPVLDPVPFVGTGYICFTFDFMWLESHSQFLARVYVCRRIELISIPEIIEFLSIFPISQKYERYHYRASKIGVARRGSRPNLDCPELRLPRSSAASPVFHISALQGAGVEFYSELSGSCCGPYLIDKFDVAPREETVLRRRVGRVPAHLFDIG